MVKRHKKNNRNSKYITIGGYRIKVRLLFRIAIIAIVLIVFIIWRHSYLWPWPSQSEIDQRLNDVAEACIYNESSRSCTNLTNRYGITFEYCHSLADIPEIGKSIPVYGVARRNDFKPASTLSTDSEKIYPYYGCVKRMDEIDKQSGKSLITKPTTIALFGLSKIPQFSVSNCTLWYPTINYLWKQIPNMEAVKKEGNNILNVYNKCYMLSSLSAAADKINSKIAKYANNYQVQLFFQSYDDWNTRIGAGCTWYDKSFNQRCGAGSDGTKTSAGYGSMVKDFVDDMQQHLYTKYFTSKVVVTD